MHAFLPACALLLLAAAQPVRAQEDPLKSPACGAALASLQAARSQGEAAARVETLRSAAASTCLGSGTVPTRLSRVVQAPVVVPPPQVEVTPTAPPSLPAPTPLPPPVAIERLPLPSTCDATGCWTNDGTHLRHVPPNLMGPGGLCSQLGGMVYCP
ncbi:hypothetical protein H8N03_11540 [Ramlibacter sp. USB13]|uniref:DUF3761 domain-containing protein n=1 Tax=Ramlibacter cellulosilyticus TaxID=2764187 RepID=A0A923SB90_9BURK|nr:hypothetical protein [Ramlibacter cellulosilyticus]MBC5783579.1 hypothetical protein [Ramlibacter cellulosilyticus]